MILILIHFFGILPLLYNKYMRQRKTLNCAFLSILALIGVKDIGYVKSCNLSLLINLVEVSIDPYLYGIGYYEAIAQNGINGISMAGGAEIVFYGQGMSHTPANTHAIFTNTLMGSSEAGPPTACKNPYIIVSL
jgi:hypothetical protein